MPIMLVLEQILLLLLLLWTPEAADIDEKLMALANVMSTIESEAKEYVHASARHHRSWGEEGTCTHYLFSNFSVFSV